MRQGGWRQRQRRRRRSTRRWRWRGRRRSLRWQRVRRCRQLHASYCQALRRCPRSPVRGVASSSIPARRLHLAGHRRSWQQRRHRKRRQWRRRRRRQWRRCIQTRPVRGVASSSIPARWLLQRRRPLARPWLLKAQQHQRSREWRWRSGLHSGSTTRGPALTRTPTPTPAPIGSYSSSMIQLRRE